MEEENEFHTRVHTYILHACVNSYSGSGVYILTWTFPPQKLWVKRKIGVWGEEEDVAVILYFFIVIWLYFLLCFLSKVVK